MIKVIYILGYARSGSTLLDRLLGAHPQMVSTGELNNYQKWGLLDDQYCSCGTPVSICPFWANVHSRFMASIGRRSVVAQMRLQSLFERYRYRLLSAFRESLLARRFGEYSHQVTALYKAVGQVGNRQIVVDSSKGLLRAENLVAIAEQGVIDLRFVHIVRDGRGVSWSLKKPMARDPKLGQQKHFRPRSTVRTSLAWRSNARGSIRLLASLPRKLSISIRYEDLCRNPQEEVARLGGFIGVDPRPLLDVVNGCCQPGVAHLAAGSRHRMNADLAIRLDTEWQDRLSYRDQQIFWWIAGREAAQLGYSAPAQRLANVMITNGQNKAA